jgi:molybdopterin/thiamine biosynthesis adenylyltransferase
VCHCHAVLVVGRSAEKRGRSWFTRLTARLLIDTRPGTFFLTLSFQQQTIYFESWAGKRMSSSNGVGRIASHPRHAYSRAILGEELFTRLTNARVLIVGAGGIGCELLKTLALVGVGDIEVIDLDTIDISNLNRQFLFTKAHISKPKSLIASTTARSFNPLVHITPYHANVKDTTRFGWEYFAQFDVVCNALDNLDARRWVNRMCIMTGVPLVESGTAGFLGQVQPIMKVSQTCRRLVVL